MDATVRGKMNPYKTPPRKSECFPTDKRYYVPHNPSQGLPAHLSGYQQKTSDSRTPTSNSGPQLPSHMRDYKYVK